MTLNNTGEYSCVASSSNDAGSSGSGMDNYIEVATATLNVIG